MFGPTEGIQTLDRDTSGCSEIRECAPEPVEEAGQGLPATEASVRETTQSIKEELDAVRREQAKLQQAVYEAAQIQRRLCAPRETVWGEFEIAGEIFPVRYLSGDFFKVMRLGPDLGLIVGDIAGKGFSAGIWLAHMMALVQRCARRHSDPADAVAEINQDLCLDQTERPMAALFFARLDSRRNELTYCNAGLPAPLLLRHTKNVERLEKGGPMLGALEGAAFTSETVPLNSDDMLIAYSDGVTECRNSLVEEFEIERLSAAAGAVSGATAKQALFSTLATVLDFADGCSPEDDLTLLVVRRRGVIRQEQSISGSQDSSGPRRSSGSRVRLKKADWRRNSSK